MDQTKCSACGIPWVDHLGIAGTCKKLQENKMPLIELGHAKERISSLEADRLAQAEMIVALRADLADERKRKRELELILENVMKVIKATLGD